MLAHEISVRRVTNEQLGWATTDSIRTEGGERLLPKGGVIDEATLARWSEVPDGTLHLIELEDGDIHENAAGKRIAAAATGAGIRVEGPFNSRYNLNSRWKGLLVVDETRVHAINSIGDMSLFTRFSGQAVVGEQTVGGVKATPIVVAETDVKRIEAIASEIETPVVDVLPFRARRAAVVATESLHPRLRERFEQRVCAKMDWYGASGCSFAYVDPEEEQVASAITDALESGADLIMAAGGNTLDPLDPVLRSLQQIGAEMVHYGAPADPGSMFWVAQIDGKPIFNLASCAMYSESTVIDLMLPYAFAGMEIEPETVARLGYGGLLEDDMTFRFPRYDTS